jgi:hypothetical protein
MNCFEDLRRRIVLKLNTFFVNSTCSEKVRSHYRVGPTERVVVRRCTTDKAQKPSSFTAICHSLNHLQLQILVLYFVRRNMSTYFIQKYCACLKSKVRNSGNSYFQFSSLKAKCIIYPCVELSIKPWNCRGREEVGISVYMRNHHSRWR